MFRLRNIRSLNVARSSVAVVLLLAIPLARHLPVLAQLTVPAVLLVALIGYEVNAHKQWRAQIRSAE